MAAHTSAGPNVDRTYLYVPPEEKAEVEALGASWDDTTKCWYIGSDTDPAKFSEWLPGDGSMEDLAITSTQATVVCASASCWKCHSNVEVICIYCDTATLADESDEPDEPLTRLTLSYLTAMNPALAVQLERWPFFRKGFSSVTYGSYFANHCPQCGELQDDLFLHSEPDQPFYDVLHASPGSLKMSPLAGEIQLNASYSFEC
jgi:hypothetical protein